MASLGRFSAIVYKGNNYCNFLFAFWHYTKPLLKKSTLKGKNWKKFFLFRVNLFPEIFFYKIVSLENVSVPHKENGYTFQGRQFIQDHFAFVLKRGTLLEKNLLPVRANSFLTE